MSNTYFSPGLWQVRGAWGGTGHYPYSGHAWRGRQRGPKLSNTYFLSGLWHVRGAVGRYWPLSV